MMSVKSTISRVLTCLVGITLLAAPSFATLTHTGKVEITLEKELTSGGRRNRIDTETGVLHVDWDKKICDLKVRNLYAYCTLDTSQNLLTSRGDLAVKNLPQIKFNSREVEAMMQELAKGSPQEYVLKTTQISDEEGVTLPFYECRSCRVNGQGVINAFGRKGDTITRVVRRNPRMYMTFELHSVSPVPGAFQVIGIHGDGRLSADHAIHTRN